MAHTQDPNACSYLYEDYVIGSWSDWSGAPRDMACTSPVKTFDKSIRVDMRPWDFIWLHHDRGGLDTTNYSHLSFWIHGGTTGNQNLSVYANVDNEDMPPVLLMNYARPRANQWVLVKIPLADLHAANVQHLTGIWIRDLQGTGMPTFYLDGIRLIYPPSVTRLPQVSVNANDQKVTLAKTNFGVNTAFWDWHFDQLDTQSLLSDGGFQLLRYPGGMASEYDWKTNTDTKDGRMGGTNTDQFVRNARTLGAEMLFTVNYGSGTPQSAAEWVQYVNQTLGASAKYWCIGNEPYGSWEYDMQPVGHNAARYAQFTKDAMTLMKGVDPTIKIGVAGTLNETDFPQDESVLNPRTGQMVNGWMPVMLQKLKQLNAKPDFVEIHYYAGGDGRENDSFLMQVGGEMSAVMARVRQMLLDHWGSDGDTIKVYITEINNVWQNPGKQATSITNGLYLADMFAQAALEGIETFAWFDLHHSATNQYNNSRTLYGWRPFGDVGILSAGVPSNIAPPLNTPYPTFYAWKMIKAFARPGDVMVDAHSTSPLLSAYAVKTTTGKLRLMLINKSQMSPVSVPIQLTGYTAGTTIKTWKYGMLEDLRGNDILVKQMSMGSYLRFGVPAYSILVVEL